MFREDRDSLGRWRYGGGADAATSATGRQFGNFLTDVTLTSTRSPKVVLHRVRYRSKTRVFVARDVLTKLRMPTHQITLF